MASGDVHEHGRPAPGGGAGGRCPRRRGDLPREGARVRVRGSRADRAKGKAEPVPVWMRRRRRRARSVRSDRSPLVGREDELERLLALWDALRRARRPGLVTVLVGAPGIGKSRLAAELAHARGRDAASVSLGPLPLVRRGHHVLAARGDRARTRPESRATTPPRRSRRSSARCWSRCRPTISMSCGRSPPRSRTWSAPYDARRARTRRPRSPRPSSTGASGASSSCRRASARWCSSSRTCTGPSRRCSS